jgi:riboflavin kinase/FMN adenylyltransferase
VKVWRDLGEFNRDPVDRAYVTVGFFDGVHLGHRAMLNELREMAELGGGSAIVVTFGTAEITSWQTEALNYTDERLEKLAASGIDGVLLLDFDENLQDMDAARFVDRFIADGLGAAGVCVGYDHRFGRGGTGDFSLVASMGKKCGFEVRAAAPLAIDGRVISSTFIRGKVRLSDVLGAARLLGYRYELEGDVVAGEGLGGVELGYPTANIEPRLKLLPGRGVYACFIYIGPIGGEPLSSKSDLLNRLPVGSLDGPYGAFLNIGTRPTVSDSNELSVEAHLFGYSGSLVGRNLRFRFVDFIREERKFRGIPELRDQLKIDEVKARQILLGPIEEFSDQ